MATTTKNEIMNKHPSVPDPNELGKICLESFESLAKTGKPVINEWTVLSCICMYRHGNQIDVVAIGTGKQFIPIEMLFAKL